MSKIKVCMCESYTTIITKEWVEVDSEMYEDTKGMSPEELQEYIEENYNKMNPTLINVDNFNSLSDELNEMSMNDDQTFNQKSWLEFKSLDNDVESGDE